MTIVGEYSRRDFLKTGAVVGVTVASMGALSGCAAEDPAKPAESLEPQEPNEPEEQTAAPVAEPGGDTIYIVDLLHCKPGDGKALFDHYVKTYVPGAEARGMTLVNSSVNPPIWLTDDTAGNTLEFVWSIAGMMGWAGMVGSSRYDPEVAPALIEFWQDIDDRVESRTRTLSAPDCDVESLTTLANLG